ncbi:MAG: hypothetical protein R3B09_09705 [Nannocystaceae bacterium]
MDAPPPSSAPRTLDADATDRLLRGLLLGLFAGVLVRTAWACDDAFITLRTVDNFVHGYGLVWNTFERVQAFTHPLWMLLVSAFYFVTREGYFTVIVLGSACSLAAVSIVSARLTSTPRQGILAVLILLLSRSFVDYSTSGLENPLLALLLVLFVVVYVGQGRRRALHLALITALALLTRMDAALLLGPALLVALRAGPWRASLRALALGMIPFVAWELFSLVYYGFLFPNTAYAKLAHQIPARALFQQGFVYFLRQASHDPLSLAVIGAAVVGPALLRARALWPLSLGLVLYALYILKIGGDFMAGRFFAAPLILAVAILGRLDLRLPTHGLLGVGGVVLLLGLGVAHPTITSDEGYGEDRHALVDRGVADERAYYYPDTGVLRYRRGRKMPDHPWAADGRGLRRHPELVYPQEGIGMIAFRAGPTVRMVDVFGLADPLIARLPALRGDHWRIGHFGRHLPAGYLQTLEDGEDRLLDPNLAEYSRQLRLVTAGPLFTAERWAAIWWFNTGQLDRLIDVDFYRAPIYHQLTDVALRRPKRSGTPWDGIDVFRLPRKESLRVALGARDHHRVLDVSLDHDDEYRFELERDDAVVWEAVVPVRALKTGGLRRLLVRLPEGVARDGYDAVRIQSLAGDGRASIGHLIPIDRDTQPAAPVDPAAGASASAPARASTADTDGDDEEAAESEGASAEARERGDEEAAESEGASAGAREGDDEEAPVASEEREGEGTGARATDPEPQ